MKKVILIVVAMDKELTKIKSELSELSHTKIINHDVYFGNLYDSEIILAKTGIGKVAAASFLTLLIERFSPSFVINVGIAGGYDRNLKTLDTIIATSGVYSDVDMLNAGCDDIDYGQLEDKPSCFKVEEKLLEKVRLILKNEVKYGMIATGDQFVTNYDNCQKIVKKYKSSYDILAFDMESTAILQVCFEYNLPCLVVRTISDIIGSTSILDYMKFITSASDKANDICKKIIKEL